MLGRREFLCRSIELMPLIFGENAPFRLRYIEHKNQLYQLFRRW